MRKTYWTVLYVNLYEELFCVRNEFAQYVNTHADFFQTPLDVPKHNMMLVNKKIDSKVIPLPMNCKGALVLHEKAAKKWYTGNDNNTLFYADSFYAVFQFWVLCKNNLTDFSTMQQFGVDLNWDEFQQANLFHFEARQAQCNAQNKDKSVEYITVLQLLCFFDTTVEHYELLLTKKKDNTVQFAQVKLHTYALRLQIRHIEPFSVHPLQHISGFCIVTGEQAEILQNGTIQRVWITDEVHHVCSISATKLVVLQLKTMNDKRLLFDTSLREIVGTQAIQGTHAHSMDPRVSSNGRYMICISYIADLYQSESPLYCNLENANRIGISNTCCACITADWQLCATDLKKQITVSCKLASQTKNMNVHPITTNLILLSKYDCRLV